MRRTIWFTDILTHRMDYIKASGRNQRSAGSATAVVADGFSRPNGLCFSPDENTLYSYVTDTSGYADGRAEPAGDLRRLDATLRVRF